MNDQTDTGRIKTMLASAESKVKDLQQSLHDAESRISRMIDNKTRDFSKRANLLAGEASLNARRKAEDAKVVIRDRPLEAVGAGIAIGLIAGIVLGLTFRSCCSTSREDEELTEE